jgi:hypothetical protein
MVSAASPVIPMSTKSQGSLTLIESMVIALTSGLFCFLGAVIKGGILSAVFLY